MSVGILFAGIAKDVNSSIPYVLANIERYGNLFDRYQTIIVENDSSDGTKEFLQTWARGNAGRTHIDADAIAKGYDACVGGYTNRLALLRDLYIERLENESELLYPFLVILDCDDVNVRPVSLNAILEAVRFLSQETRRAAVFANQRGFYYDIWALRQEVWCPGDCWEEHMIWAEAGFGGEAQWSCIGSRQVHIPPRADPIEVKSAFGGLAIYKRTFLKGIRYSDSRHQLSTCEHVKLNLEIGNRGGHLFIYPFLQNSTQYEHIKRPRDLHYWVTRLRERWQE